MAGGLWEVVDPVIYERMGGEASLGEIFTAGRNEQVFAHSTKQDIDAIEQAYDERINAIALATGELLTNPIRATHMPVLGYILPSDASLYQAASARQEFQQKLGDLATRFPDQAPVIGLDRPIEEDAFRIQRQAEIASGTALTSSKANFFAKWGAYLAGSMVGSLRDPISTGLMVLGGGPGAARTVAGRILTVAAKEAVIGGAGNAFIAAATEDMRARAGLDTGLDEIVSSAVFGALGGAAFGAAGRGLVELGGAFRPRQELPPPPPPPAPAATTAAAAAVPTPEPVLRPEVRGAIDAVETDAAFRVPATIERMTELPLRDIRDALKQVETTEAAVGERLGTRTEAAAAAREQLAAPAENVEELRLQATNLAGEAARVREEIAGLKTDPATDERLAAIDTELGTSGLTRVRRDLLERERDLIRGTLDEAAPADARRLASLEQEATGLDRARLRAERRLATEEKRQTGQETRLAGEEADIRREADASSARLRSSREILDRRLRRSIQRLASDFYGLRLGRDDAEHFAGLLMGARDEEVPHALRLITDELVARRQATGEPLRPMIPPVTPDQHDLLVAAGTAAAEDSRRIPELVAKLPPALRQPVSSPAPPPALADQSVFAGRADPVAAAQQRTEAMNQASAPASAGLSGDAAPAPTEGQARPPTPEAEGLAAMGTAGLTPEEVAQLKYLASQIDPEALMLNENGEAVRVGDVLDDSRRLDGIAGLIDGCRI